VFLPGLGNAVSLLPFLHEARQLFPHSRIVLWCKEKVVRDLLMPEELIDSIVICPNKTADGWLQCRLAQIQSLLTLRKTRFDVVFFVDRLIVLFLFMRLFIRCRYTVSHTSGTWFDRFVDSVVDYTENNYEAFVRMNLLRPWSPDVRNERARLRITDAENREATKNMADIQNGRMLIGIHPGCSGKLERKRWSSENFREFISTLLSKYPLQIILFGGEDDQKISSDIKNGFPDNQVFSLVSRLPIRQTAACIAECDLFISNDSGLMHVAAAVKTPTIALFGASSVEKNAPPYPDIHVIDGRYGPNSKEPMLNIDVETVVKKTSEIIDVLKLRA
jgi:heptosyltransferase-2